MFQDKDLSFIKKETLAQVFSGEFCEMLKSVFFTRMAPSDFSDYSWI